MEFVDNFATTNLTFHSTKERTKSEVKNSQLIVIGGVYQLLYYVIRIPFSAESSNPPTNNRISRELLRFNPFSKEMKNFTHWSSLFKISFIVWICCSRVARFKHFSTTFDAYFSNENRTIPVKMN